MVVTLLAAYLTGGCVYSAAYWSSSSASLEAPGFLVVIDLLFWPIGLGLDVWARSRR